MARHVMQGKAGFMYADGLWVELPGYPSSWVSLAFTFLLPATPCYSASPWHPSLLGSCNLWTASGLSHSSLGSGSDDLCNWEPSPSFRRRRMGGGHPGTIPAPCWWGSHSPRMLSPCLGHIYHSFSQPHFAMGRGRG